MDDSKTLNLNVRKDFPILSKKILEKKDLIYFDTAASAQKPNTVIDETNDFYKNHYSNVSRGVHTLSVESTFRYEDARKKVQKFLNARSENEIIFTKSATEGINLVAQTFYEKFMQKGDEVILSLNRAPLKFNTLVFFKRQVWRCAKVCKYSTIRRN